MPIPVVPANIDRPKKRLKLQPKAYEPPLVVFRSGSDIREALSSQSPDAQKNSLLNLRNQLAIHPHEIPISSNDARLLLAHDWLTKSPGALELFEIWNSSVQNDQSVQSLAIAILAALLTLLSQHFIYQSDGDPIIQQLVSSTYMRRLNAHLGGPQNDLILMTLKLFNAMVGFADGREKRAIMDGFAWGMKSLPKLLAMRRRAASGGKQDSFAKADIRTLFITFILSFVSPTTPAPVKTALLEDRKNTFILIFKGLHQDPYDLVRYILEICWEGIWSDGRIRRTAKVRVFTEQTLLQLAKLYARGDPEGEDASDIPADVVHHFLLAITSRRGIGLCFHDRGWYPPQVVEGNDEVSGSKSRSGRVHNVTLANFLKSLKVNEDPRQQELAIKILRASPEIIQGYWSVAGISLEPRLSSRWITNMAYFGAVISLPVPTYCFSTVLSKGSLSTPSYNPSPPPLSAIVENVIPSIFTKIFATKGLQLNSEPLVRHCTSLALAKCLDKFESIRQAFMTVEAALEENAETGQWMRRRLELEKEVRRRVPDFQVVVALSQRNVSALASTSALATATVLDQSQPGETTRNELLSEASLRLMWLYHRSLPSLAAEARFDPGKLLLSMTSKPSNIVHPGSSATVEHLNESSTNGMSALGQLHVLRLLQESDQFSWSAKLATTNHSHLYHVLQLFTRTRSDTVRDAAASLIISMLSRNILFEHDPLEIHLWLMALPLTARSPTAQGPDGVPLTDERDGVLLFLDHCIQRCLRTPYRYVEESLALLFTEDNEPTTHQPDLAPSPLLISVLEHFTEQQTSKVLTASDTLALATFLRKLTLSIMVKHSDLRHSERISTRVLEVLRDPISVEKYPAILAGVSRERRLLVSGLLRLHSSSSLSLPHSPRSQIIAVQDFLNAVESSQPDEMTAQWAAAELIDWVRLIDQPLSTDDVFRLVRIIEQWSINSFALREFFFHVEPTHHGLLSIILRRPHANGLMPSSLPFEVAFMMAGNDELLERDVQAFLLELLFGKRTSPQVARVARVVCHRAASPTELLGDTSNSGSLSLLVRIVQQARVTPDFDISSLQVLIFKQSPFMRSMFFARTEPLAVLSDLVRVTLDAASESDRLLAADYCSHWKAQIEHAESSTGSALYLLPALHWIPYMDDEALLRCLDAVVGILTEDSTMVAHHDPLHRVLEAVCSAVGTSTSPETIVQLRKRIPSLLSFSRLSISSQPFEKLVSSLIDAHFPLGFNHRLDFTSKRQSIDSLHGVSLWRWSDRLDRLPPHLSTPDVLANDWTPFSAQILAALIYQSPSSRYQFGEWLAAEINKVGQTPDFIVVIHAFLDSCAVEPDPERFHTGTHATFELMPHLIDTVAETSTTRHLVTMAGDCLCLLFTLHPQLQTKFAHQLREKLESFSPKSLFRKELQTLIFRLALCDGRGILRAVIDIYIDLGMQWIVRQFAENTTDSANFLDFLEIFGRLIPKASEIKAHLADPVLSAGIQNRLASRRVLNFMYIVASHTKLKPVNSNRLLQNILQHQAFLANPLPISEPLTWPAIVALLHALFFMHPINASQPSHISPLLKVYRGTLAITDRRLLSIFRLFEQHRHLSLLAVFKRWTASAVGSSSKALDALTSLDPTIVMKTCISFPSHAVLSDPLGYDAGASSIYDPNFVLALLASTLLDDGSTLSGMEWVALFRSNSVCVAIRALSSKLPQLREIASQVLLGLWAALQEPAFQERDQALYVLNLVKDALPPSTSPVARLPTYSTLLLAHALRCVFYPSNFMYPITSRFLLQRPEIDKGDVPMLFNLLYSSSDDWRKERIWMIRFLADGMKSSQDWKILTRRHTWELLATLFQASDSDSALRTGILDVLTNITSNMKATTSLVLGSSLLSWIDIQLLGLREDEADAWIEILDNIVRCLNHDVAERATLGSWRRSIIACLGLISASQGSLERLHAIARILTRIPSTDNESPTTAALFKNILEWLTQLERSLVLSSESVHEVIMFQHRKASLTMQGGSAFDPSLITSPPLWTWGTSVEFLWEVIMNGSGEANVELWGALTSRLLVWNAVSRESVAGEWARRETTRLLQTQRE